MIAIGTAPDDERRHVRLIIIDHEKGSVICSMNYTIDSASSLMKQLNQAIIEAKLLYSPEQPE